MLTANYHTHTPRCHHAKGEEREYIEKAIEMGFKTLGFADHSPQFYTTDFVSNMRMTPDDFPGYVDTLLKLKAEYRDKIDILIGLETEYFPKSFGRLMDFLKDYPIDYLILGQHQSFNEEDGFYLGSPTGDPDWVKIYTDQVVEGIKTNKFSYVAHPDLINFHGDLKYYDLCMDRICKTAREHDLPLEINLLGILGNRCYPNKRFWKIAKENGNKAIIGVDAHWPDMLNCKENYEKAMQLVNDLQLDLVDTIKLTMR